MWRLVPWFGAFVSRWAVPAQKTIVLYKLQGPDRSWETPSTVVDQPRCQITSSRSRSALTGVTGGALPGRTGRAFSVALGHSVAVTMRKARSASVIESKKALASAQMSTCGMFVINARIPPKTKVSKTAFTSTDAVTITGARPGGCDVFPVGQPGTLPSCGVSPVQHELRRHGLALAVDPGDRDYIRRQSNGATNLRAGRTLLLMVSTALSCGH